MRSPSALMEFTPQSAIPTDGVDSGDGLTMSDDEVPMCIDNGNPVSSQAEKTGSQWPVGNEGSPSGCGFSTKRIALLPLAAQRSISAAARSGSHNGTRVWGMKRSG